MITYKAKWKAGEQELEAKFDSPHEMDLNTVKGLLLQALSKQFINAFQNTIEITQTVQESINPPTVAEVHPQGSYEVK